MTACNQWQSGAAVSLHVESHRRSRTPRVINTIEFYSTVRAALRLSRVGCRVRGTAEGGARLHRRGREGCRGRLCWQGCCERSINAAASIHPWIRVSLLLSRSLFLPSALSFQPSLSLSSSFLTLLAPFVPLRRTRRHMSCFASSERSLEACFSPFC